MKKDLETALSVVRSNKREIAKKTTKVLTLDIETSPSLSYIFDVWRDKVGVGKLVEHTSVICFAAKWYDSKTTMFASDFHDGHAPMLDFAWRLIDEADIIVTYNGIRFDMRRLNSEFFLADMDPPKPYKNVDLYRSVKDNFDFPSNGLNYISERAGIGSKVKHAGFELWRGCLMNDENSWNTMRRYCKGDVVLTEKLYDKIRPWVKNHPHVFVDSSELELRCNKCGSMDLEPIGDYTAVMMQYPQFRCNNCGGTVKASKSNGRIAITSGV